MTVQPAVAVLVDGARNFHVGAIDRLAADVGVVVQVHGKLLAGEARESTGMAALRRASIPCQSRFIWRDCPASTFLSLPAMAPGRRPDMPRGHGIDAFPIENHEAGTTRIDTRGPGTALLENEFGFGSSPSAAQDHQLLTMQPLKQAAGPATHRTGGREARLSG
jgi:hypothetical protein